MTFATLRCRAALAIGVPALVAMEAGCHSTTSPPAPSGSDGACGGYGTERASQYVLPYGVGEGYLVIQGNCGSFSHFGALKYAYDFRMPIGNPVRAARAGIVTFVQQQFPDGTGRAGEENLVVVRGRDGLFDRYIHLTQQGAAVHIGDELSRGDLVGRSGNSGFSTEPHLHFDVTAVCSAITCQTVPILFSNTAPHPSGLLQGMTYVAEPF